MNVILGFVNTIAQSVYALAELPELLRFGFDKKLKCIFVIVLKKGL